MQEIQPGLWHWSTAHAKWGITIHSYYLSKTGGGAVIDPRVPAELRRVDELPHPRSERYVEFGRNPNNLPT